MAAFFKYTMIFDYFSGITASNPVPIRVGGWSESYYAATFGPGIEGSFQNLMAARLGFCPRGTAINKYRIQQVNPTGASILRRTRLNAPDTWLSDVPQMALKLQFAPDNGTPAFLREFRGLPDVQVTTGEYTPSLPFTIAVTAFLTALQTGTWNAVRRDRTLTQYKIASISPAGVVVMIDAFAAVGVGSQVQVIRSIDPTTGRKIGYFATVTAFTDDNHFTISGPKVRISNFGTMRLAVSAPAAFSGAQLSTAQAVVRKVGRPSKSYTGRASKRA